MDHIVIVCAGAALAAGFTQGFSGFGGVVVALPLLLTALPPRAAVPLVSLMALIITVVMVLRLRGHVRKGPMKTLLTTSLFGMTAGACLLDGIPDFALSGLLGLVVLFVVLTNLSTPGAKAELSRKWTALAGFASGALGILIGANGPPVVIWASRQPWGRDELRGTLTLYFLVSGVLIVTTQSLKGMLTGRVAGLFGWSLPALLAGLWLGFAACGRVSDRTFRKVILTLLALIGTRLLFEAAMAMAGH